MAIFLWTSKVLGPTATIADHIAKYCWNAPGNWKVWNSTTSSWGATLSTPNTYNTASNTALVGCQYHPTYGQHRVGWTAASHPILFGGFGASASNPWQGNWYYLKAEQNYPFGNTWTNSLGGFKHLVGLTNPSGGELSRISGTAPLSYSQLTTVYDYPFPYLGGGITGEIANWCAARDGITADQYVTANYPGYHNPSAGLNLKLRDVLIIEDLRVLQQGDPSSLPTGSTKFLANINCIPAPFTISGLPNPIQNYTTGATYNPLVCYTDCSIVTYNGSGIVLNGGIFQYMDINTASSELSGIIAGVKHHNRSKLYADTIDYGVQLKDTTCWRTRISDAQTTTLRGGNYARVELRPLFGMGSTYPYMHVGSGWTGTYQQTNGITLDYRGGYYVTQYPQWRVPYDAPTITLANGWNWLQPMWMVRGLTGNNVDYTPLTDAGVLEAVTTSQISLPYSSYTNIYQEPGVQNIATNPNPNPPYGLQSHECLKARRRIILGDPENPAFEGANVANGGASGGGIQKISIRNMYDSTLIPAEGGSSGGTIPNVIVNYLPWSLEFASKAQVQNIEAVNGYIGVDPSLDPAATIRVGQVTMKMNSVLDLTASKGTPDFRAGTIKYSGGIGYPVGGILFEDNTSNKIIGDAGCAYWNSFITQNRSVRNPTAGEIPTYTTSSTDI